MIKSVSIIVRGKVQGVGFRYNAMKEAKELRLLGFVKNNYDGSVYIEATGEEDKIELFINWCYKGSKWAMVEDVNVSEIEKTVFNSFSVKQ